MEKVVIKQCKLLFILFVGLVSASVASAQSERFLWEVHSPHILSISQRTMDSVGNLHDIFECYSASNWYGKSKKCYSGLVKQWPLSFPAMLRPVYHERAKSSGGTRDVFLLSDAGNTNQLLRLEIVCADSIKLAHRAMLEYFSSCSAVQPFPIASDDTGSVGDYCYFGYGKPWTSVMFVRDNVFVALKSLASMSSVRQEAEAIDKEIMRLASGNYDSGMAAGIAEEQKASSLNLSGIVAKTNVVGRLQGQTWLPQ